MHQNVVWRPTSARTRCGSLRALRDPLTVAEEIKEKRGRRRREKEERERRKGRKRRVKKAAHPQKLKVDA